MPKSPQPTTASLKCLLVSLAGVAMMGSACDASAEITRLTPKDCQMMESKGVITDRNPVSCRRLVRVTFPYVNFQNQQCEGVVVVWDVIAEETEKAFKELYKQGFPIAHAHPMEYYAGDDQVAMADNNTSAFNGRSITGQTDWSKHAYGVALDINPVQNPYIAFESDGSTTVLPAASREVYVNRSRHRPFKPVRPGMSEEIVNLMARHGFLIWGGDWDTPIDYQHFEVGTRRFLKDLVRLPEAKAKAAFEKYVADYRHCLALRPSNENETQKRLVCTKKVLK